MHNKKRNLRRFALVIEILIVFFTLIGIAQAIELKGLYSIDDFYSDDSSSKYDLNLITSRLRLDVNKIDDTENFSFHFDARARKNLGSPDYHSNFKSERIDVANLEYIGKEKQFHLLVGRLWPKEISTDRVDGINLLYKTNSNLGFGMFGGLKPDPYVDDFNSDFTSAGTYVSYQKDDRSAGLAFTYNSFKGRVDRQYIFGQSSFGIVKSIRFFGQVTADINQNTNGTDLTSVIAMLSYRSDYGSGISVGFNRFKVVKLFESMDFEIPDISQHSYYVSGDYRFLDTYTLYGRYELQKRYDGVVPDAQNESYIYVLGLRNDNLLNTEMSVDISSTLSDSFNSGYEAYNLEIARFFRDRFQLSLRSSYSTNKYDLFYDDEILTYGAAASLFLGRRWSINISYDVQHSKNYDTKSIFSRLSYKF